MGRTGPSDPKFVQFGQGLAPKTKICRLATENVAEGISESSHPDLIVNALSSLLKNRALR